MIDKSIRADYAIQGGGPNYLGKQKMVKAPKKWQSSPDHDPAELAYITEKEKDILIALDVHGSLKDGKPNRGPSGIISLQGDMGSIGGGGSSGGGGGGGGGGRDRWDWSPAPAPAPAPTPDYSSLDNEEQAAVDRNEPTAQMTPTERNEQGYGPGGTDNPDYKRKQFEETGDIDELTDLTGFDTAPKVDIADIHGETDDPDSVSYDPTYIPSVQAEATRQLIQPTTRTGLMQSFMDTSPKIDVKDAIGRGVFNVGLKKLGLGAINPLVGLFSMLRGKPTTAYDLAKNLKSNIRTPSNVIDTRTSAIDTRADREGRVDMQPKEKPTAVAKDPITKGIETYTGKKQDSTDLMSLYKILLQNRNRLTPQGLNIFSLISRYLRKPFEGRSRDIG